MGPLGTAAFIMGLLAGFEDFALNPEIQMEKTEPQGDTRVLRSSKQYQPRKNFDGEAWPKDSKLRKLLNCSLGSCYRNLN